MFLEVSKVGRITTGGQVTAEYPLPARVFIDEVDIVLGPDSNFWFTNGSALVMQMTPTGTITQYPVPGTNPRATGLTVGPDGNLWFTDNSQGYIGRISP